ncbi:MAG: hypothetical protein OEY34_03235, partial [Cyclobacteriaceae bacterium]|nr:hypothetical protein [Cyclobacteriaceae bacterium]
TLNGNTTFEPRLQISWEAGEKHLISGGYGLYSMLLPRHIYLYPIIPGPAYSSQNESLESMMSGVGNVIYQFQPNKELNFSAEVYYQKHFNAPINEVNGYTYSLLNYLEEESIPLLSNDGTGKNYGLELNVEKGLSNSSYFLVGGSLYSASFAGQDNIDQKGRFDGGYTLNTTWGRETDWSKGDKKRTLNYSARFLYLGGFNDYPVNEFLSAKAGTTIFDQAAGFSQPLEDYYRLDFSISIRKQKENYTRILALDMQNMLSRENQSYFYYDNRMGEVIDKRQLGIMPILVYRVEF